MHESKWCHMTADSTEELVAFALKLGLQAKYIQFKGTWKEHFDVTEQKRRKAVLLGAVEVSFRERIKQMRDNHHLNQLQPQQPTLFD